MLRIAGILTLVVLIVVPAQGLPTLVGDPVTGRPGETGTLYVHSDDSLAYVAWLEIRDPNVVGFADCPWPPGPPGSIIFCRVDCYPEFGAWVQITVASNDPAKPIQPGDHIQIDILYKAKGETFLNLYAEDGVTKLDGAQIIVIPEPATFVLLGVGAWFMRRQQSGKHRRSPPFAFAQAGL